MVPIRNLWNLLQYAWGVLEHEEFSYVSAGEVDHPIDLLAFALVRTVEPIVKQGLDRIYLAENESLPTVRGSIDFEASVATASLSRRELICRTEGLSADFNHNRIIKAALKLLTNQAIDRSIRSEVTALMRRFANIDDIRLTPDTFRKIHLHRNNRRYSIPISICRMLFEEFRIADGGEIRNFEDFIRDEVRMRRVFEVFVRNFLKQRMSPEFKIGGKRINWTNLSGSSSTMSHLPTMQMDVVVESQHQALIIDTKYTERALVDRWTAERFRAEHLYQIFSYVENYSKQNGNLKVSGMLLYPAIGEQWTERFEIDGRAYKIVTLSLDAEWHKIKERLLELCALP